MELATNTFTKGLLCDTHPMITGTDVMTDCLNGTLITQNGNEVILLNDMGNRRVNNAFLPSGYQPVGMKEYGGIIYVAAYNPITNKSLIGSFPSPQRKIGDISDNLSGQFDFNKFFTTKTSDLDDYNVEIDEYLNIPVLKSDSFIISLTGDKVLRAGDKFSIYSEDLYSLGITWLKENVTNFYNTSNNKVISPKNRKYTLSIGVLNSQNEFVDITKTLCRWKVIVNESKILNYDSSFSDLYKFNDGYFIAKDFSNLDLIESISDSNLIKARLKLEVNTYAYKLVGPLYLKALLNHIEKFDYNIYGIYNNGIATIWIEGYITYNCPDNVLNVINSSNDLYSSFEEGDVKSFNGFDLWSEGLKILGTREGNSISKYDPDSNTYSVKIVKKYTNIYSENNIFNYVIGVNAFNDIKDVYIKDLSAKGSLNLSLFGSGTLNLTGWLYFISDDRMILSYTLDSYPKYGETFTNLKFTFKDLNSDNTYSFEDTEVFNGRRTKEILFGESVDGKFESGKVYLVTATYFNNEEKLDLEDIKTTLAGFIEYNFKTQSEETLAEQELSARWILTTKLFNIFYNNVEILDFCNNNNSEFLQKMELTLQTELNVKQKKSEESTEVKVNNLIVLNTNDKIEYKEEHNFKLDYTSDSTKISILNEELYPISITEGEDDSLKISNITSSTIFNSPEITGSGEHLNEESWVDISMDNGSTNVKFIDHFKGDASTTELSSIKNLFKKIEGIISNVTPRDEGEFCGLAVSYDDLHYGEEDGHFLEFIHHDSALHLTEEYTDGEDDDEMPDNSTRIKTVNGDDTLTGIGQFKFMDWQDTIFHSMSAHCPNLMFTYVCIPWNSYYSSGLLPWGKSCWGPGNDDAKYYTLWVARVWWRSDLDTWAWFKDILCTVLVDEKVNEGSIEINIDRKEPVKKSSVPGTYPDGYSDDLKAATLAAYIKILIDENLKSSIGRYIYCAYNNKSPELDLYSLGNSYQYNNHYSFKITSEIDFKVDDDSVIKIRKPKIGNLDFTVTLPERIFTTIETTLESSETFQQLILDYIFNRGEVESIYITEDNTLITKDSLGKSLDPNYVYVLNNSDQLVKVGDSKNNFKIGTDIKGKNSENILLYTGNTKGNPTYRYNLNGDDNNHYLNYTSLDFSSIQIVKLPQ